MFAITNSQMKIALLSVFYPFRGGIAQFGAKLYRALEDKHDVQAYSFKRQYPSILFPGKSQFVEEKDEADKIPSQRILDSINPISFGKTAREIKRNNPDIVISQYWMTFFGPSFGAVHKKLRGIKRITILHNVIPHEKRFFDSAANKYFLKENEGFVVMSDKVRQDLLSVKPDAKYLRIDHPVYNQFGDKIDRKAALKELKLQENRKYLLFFGFIREYKGLDLLIESLSLLDESIHLIVAGEIYGSFEKYEEQIKRLNLQNRVHLFTNYISDEQVAAFFSAADVCVLPYKSATQSGISAISENFNLPQIVTNTGGLAETIEHEKTGLIVNQINANALVEAIELYFTNNYQLTFSRAINDRKMEKSWENFAEKIIQFAKEI